MRLLRTVETCCVVNHRGSVYYEHGNRLCINLPVTYYCVVLIPAAGITVNWNFRTFSQQNGVAVHTVLALLRTRGILWVGLIPVARSIVNGDLGCFCWPDHLEGLLVWRRLSSSG